MIELVHAKKTHTYATEITDEKEGIDNTTEMTDEDKDIDFIV